MEVHICNPSEVESEVGGLWSEVDPMQKWETLLKSSLAEISEVLQKTFSRQWN
jgi:hypothetical protein